MQEIGIRMALGAEGGDLRSMMVRQGMKLAGLGILIVLAGALALSPLTTTRVERIGPPLVRRRAEGRFSS